MSSPITTHVLDTARGAPAAGLLITLERRDGETWTRLAAGSTNDDGRIADLLAGQQLTEATYKMRFETGPYFQAQGIVGFYPYVEVVFTITAPGEHYHVPLLLSPFGYSTYRGS